MKGQKNIAYSKLKATTLNMKPLDAQTFTNNSKLDKYYLKRYFNISCKPISSFEKQEISCITVIFKSLLYEIFESIRIRKPNVKSRTILKTNLQFIFSIVYMILFNNVIPYFMQCFNIKI